MNGFNYGKLNGRITEIFGKQSAFARAMGWSERTTSLKLNGKIDFRQSEMVKAIDVLNISVREIPSYFFAKNV